MRQRPRVSVVVLGYNEKRYLKDCLSALLDQDYPEEQYEILYVDNASNELRFWGWKQQRCCPMQR
jgi:glycosyltransferase involved in cell wall biosynthesis